MANHIFEDNFDSYVTGDLQGQGGWIRSTGALSGVFVVSETAGEFYAGSKGLKIVGDGNEIGAKKPESGDAEPGGQNAFMVKVDTKVNAAVMLRFRNGGTDYFGIHFNANDCVSESGNHTLISNYSTGVWYQVAVRWATTAHPGKVSFKVDNKPWSAWVNAHWDWTGNPGPNNITIFTVAISTVYVDEITEAVFPSFKPKILTY